MIYTSFRSRWASGLVNFAARRVSVALVNGYVFKPEHRTISEAGHLLTTVNLNGQMWTTEGKKEIFTAEPVLWPDRSFDADGAVYYFADTGELMTFKVVKNRPVFRLEFPNGILTLGTREE